MMGMSEFEGVPDKGPGHLRSRIRIGAGPILAILGILGWFVLYLIPLVVWSGYNEQTDVLAMDYFSRGLISVLLILAGSGACFSLSLVGTIMSVFQWRERGDRWAILGSLLGILGLLPMIVPVAQLGFGL